VGYSTKSAITVNRVPRGDGSAEINFQSGCANEFGCVPTHEMLLASFAAFVGAPTTAPMSGPAHPALGVHFAPLDAASMAALHFLGDHGLFVAIVNAGSPAAAAGIQQGDVIESFGGRPMSSIADLQGAMAEVTPGTSIAVHLWRGGRELDATVRF
jgi:S1-C subfamily serine protease